MAVRILLIGFLVLFGSAAGPSSAAEKLPRVPPGFTIERVTTPDLVKHPMMAGFDDRGRLFVVCSAGKNLKAAELLKDPPNFIAMLEDTNGDGKFDKSTVFADKMTLPMGALWYRNALYVASPPHIWKLEDTNNDGVLDKRTILVDRFGFSGNAASVHGCFLGPTGRIYWCDGRHGHEFRDKAGKVTSKGKAARIFSCKPDGSDVRTHCGGGMDNPVEIDFTETGEMIGSVNILLSKPRGDCLVHWVEGGVYPRHDQQKVISEFKRTGDLLPPMTDMGHVAVSGMMRYRSDQFGKAFQNNIFTTQFNTHKVVRSVLKRSGSTFTSTEHEFLQSDDPDFHPTDVLEDADGSLLVIDTGGWFRIGCPVSKVAKPHIYGAIYRIRKTGAHKVADPRGLKLGFDKMPAKDAVKYLDDPRWVVREKAIERLALVAEVSTDELSAVIKDRKRSVVAKRNAVWAMRRGMHDDIFGLLRGSIVKAVSDADESVRITAANALGGISSFDFLTASWLLPTAKSQSPSVRRGAARAIGYIEFGTDKFADLRKRSVAQSLFTSLVARGTDRVLEHTIIYSLIKIADRESTLPYLNDKNPAVRRAALIALDQMDGGKLTRELVTPLLDTDDPPLQKTALAVIAKHAGWAKETLSLVRTWLTADAKLTPERTAMLRGFLVAQSADKDVQSLVAELAQSPKTAAGKRLLLLEVMQRSSVPKYPASWVAAVRVALQSKQPAVRLQGVRIAGERRLGVDDLLKPIAFDRSHSVELRAETLIAMSPRLKEIDTPALRWLASELKRDHPPLTQLTVARAIAAAPWNVAQLVELAKSLSSADPLTAPVLLRTFEKSQSETVGLALVKSLSRSKAVKALPAAELNRLFRKYPAIVQSAAKPLLAALGVNPAEQERRMNELLKLADGGNAERGRVIFNSKKAACVSCHTVAGQGGKVGPDLTTIGKIRQPRDLVEALAFPSATIARGFRTYIVVTDRGKIHTGIISRETSSEIVLRTAELAEIRIPRGSIEALRESPTSIMPQRMDKILSPEELRDLLAFLRSRK